MKLRNRGAIIGLLFTAMGFSSMVNAALISRLGGQAYYDNVADLTWAADANINGTMSWTSATNWASILTIGGVGGWRLPDTVQPDATCSVQSGGISYGTDCTGSEMGNLFYNVLGGSAGSSITTSNNANYDLFSNVQSGGYWSATEYAPNPSVAWYFGTDSGGQYLNSKSFSNYAWAVQSGDVSAVPIPAAVWLFGSGLLGLAGVARRKR